jgi:hypothetical protein
MGATLVLALRDNSSVFVCSWAKACEGQSSAAPAVTSQNARTTPTTHRRIVAKRTGSSSGKGEIPHALKCNADASSLKLPAAPVVSS